MHNRRWWDIAVGGATVAVAVAVFVAVGGEGSALAAALTALAVSALAYATLVRPAFVHPAGWRYPAYLIVTAVVFVTGVAATPTFAILQVVAFPLMWVVGDTRRRGIFGSAVIALSACFGLIAGNGFSTDAIASGLMSALFTFAFATALGLWITSIMEYGDERARLVAELTAAQDEIEALSRARGASDERERLARDVHDTFAQTLAGLVMIAERSGRQLESGDTDAAAQSIATVETLARDALGEARELVARTASVPADAAFERSVERLAERFRAQGPPDIVLEVATGEASLDREAQVVLLRCVQEALSNVRKHADATTVRVRVATGADGTVTLEIHDDGRGFDPASPRAGFGLDGMAERAALARAEFEVISGQGAGTTVRLRLPIGEPATEAP